MEGSGELFNLVKEQTAAGRGGSSPGELSTWKRPEQSLGRAELLRYQQGQSLQAKVREKAESKAFLQMARSLLRTLDINSFPGNVRKNHGRGLVRYHQAQNPHSKKKDI